MKKILIISSLAAMFLLSTLGICAAPYMWNAGSAQEGSTAYVSIGVLSETINRFAKNDIFMTPIAYTASMLGLKGFDQKEVVSMFASSQQFSQVIEETGPFDPGTYKWTAPYQQMMWMYDLDYFIIIRKEDADKIKSWSDLANRPIWPSMMGTGTYELVKVLLGSDCLDIWDTVDEKSFSLDHTADALKLKEVDAIFAYSSGGSIVGYAQEVLARTDSVLVAPTAEELEKIFEVADFLFPAVMEPDAYGIDVGLTESIVNPTLGFIYIVDPEMPEDVVYQAVKAAFENADELAKATTIWKKFSVDPFEYNLIYLQKYREKGAEIHPGTLRYLRELGHDTRALGLE